ncbi:MAG TPA: phosphatidylserine decarboxylase [Stellaceae bacterium]|nr:phosphatidylserine decarboxylase [Stellaceae bacterium]
MLRGDFLTPLHPDGLKFVVPAAVVTVLLFVLWSPLGWIALIVTLWLAYFFRDPWRVTPNRAGLLVSPADGMVVSIAPAAPPAELSMGAAACVRIGIFLDLFSVHVTRCPIGGRVAALRYTKGRFLDASREEASLNNERMAIRIAPAEGPEIAFVQIAGLVARRIVCDLYEGQQVAVGQRMGIIRFGSRVDVYVPPPYVPMVIAGQRMIGGETVLADRLAQEPARQGAAQ